jgi:plasmid stability protein
MSIITIDIPSEVYKQLEEEARKAGKSPETLTRELLEAALHSREEGETGKVREILQGVGHVRSLGDSLKRKIIPGVTLEEVRKAMMRAGGPSLSEIVSEQRGLKP